MIFLISVSTSFRERTKQQNCWICRRFAPDNVVGRFQITSFFSATRKSTSCRSPCMDFLPPSGGVFRLSHLGVMAVYPMQTVFRFSRCGAGFGNKKSPHNDLNLTIPSGIALVRVRYVAIRKSKTCSAAQTRTFENALILAACKKTQ